MQQRNGLAKAAKQSSKQKNSAGSKETKFENTQTAAMYLGGPAMAIQKNKKQQK